MSETSQFAITIMSELKIIQHILKARMHNHFKDMELTAPQGMLVFMVSRHKTLKITDISEKMGLSNSTVSGIVDRLESQGYVKRERSKEDRRVVYVTVTEEMMKRVKMHENIMDTIMVEALQNASEDEMKQVASGLSLLSEILQKTHKGEMNQC